MSFAQEVKRDIITGSFSDDELKAELYGIIKLKAEYIISNKNLHIEIVTTSLSISRRIATLFIKLYGINLEIAYKERQNLSRGKLYYLVIRDCHEVLVSLGLINGQLNIIDAIPSIYDNNKDAVLRGMFLAKGSVNDPQKSNYHLEIACDYQEEVDWIISALAEYGIEAHMVNRKNRLIAYVKKAENIGDFLKIIGATNTLFHYENERIKRDLNNVVNRVINCDIANSDRTNAASSRQLNEIKYIEDTTGFGGLKNRLMEVILLRTSNPYSSLNEMSEISEETVGRYLSKSNINHCLRDISEMAKKLGYEEEEAND